MSARRKSKKLKVRTKWTAARRSRFCAVLREVGSVVSAASAVGLARSRAYELRDEDEQFAAEWDEAAEAWASQKIEILDNTAWVRAVDGVEEPVFGSLGAGAGTGVVGKRRVFSNALLMFLRNRVDQAMGDGKLQVEVVNFAEAVKPGKRKR